MGECKAKAIETNLGTFRHNQTYLGIIQAYLEPCVTLTYLKLWYTLIYSEPRHIHNHGTFRTLLYSERWHIQNLRHIQIPAAHLRRNIN